MRTYFGVMLLLVFIIAVVAVGYSPVSADMACTIQPSSLAYVTQHYYNYNTNDLIVPVSATCSFAGGELSAVGTATDTSTTAPAGTAPVAGLYSAYGTNIYAGRLVFSLAPGLMGHTLQISISIYSGGYNTGNYGQYSSTSPLATSVETVQVNPNYSNNYYNNYYAANCYYNNNCPQTLVVNSCQASSGQVQCVGYLYQDPNSCVVLVIPIYSSIGLVSYQYYTLQKLPSTYPAIGTWVSVTGQLNTGNNFSSTGAGCPGNYINIASISTSPTPT